jgi:hypothetical protein
MTDPRNAALKARAELAFRSPVIAVTPEAKLSALEEYKAKHAAQLASMERLKAMRMATGKR